MTSTKKQLVVLGAGESGVGAAILGKQKGFEVFVSDKGSIADTYKNVLNKFEINWEEKQHTEAKLFEAEVVVKSPGIPDTIALIIALKEKGIAVISEIEFAAKYTNATIIGITGSNGKTTTTMLTNHILQNAEMNVGMAGNIGDSFAKSVAHEQYDQYVLELSSFQLDGIIDFAPHIAMITNITPDHLDRYNYDFEQYIASKFRITMNQTSNDYLIYDADDLAITKYLETNTVSAKLIPFSLTKQLEEGVYIENNNIKVKIENNEYTMSTSELALKGNHNVKNAMAASAAAHLLRVRKATIRESLQNFQEVEHRLEEVLKINNVKYINDSKATNVNATFFALDAMKSSTIWIVGGVDKGNDYSDLFALVNEKVKAIICLGVDNRKIIHSFQNCIDTIVETSSMKEAVQAAYELAERNDSVLLSPACASFDLFESYEDRGRQFKQAVREL